VTNALVPTVCVFAGSARIAPDDHREIAARLGTTLAEAGSIIVYGGGSTGLMGAFADAALDAGAKVIGVVPRGLFAREEVHGRVDVVEVDSLHDRKQIMLELADAFVVLPGGLGTLDEVSEVLTWAQLGIHAKPIVFVDQVGFWRGVVDWLDHAIALGYVPIESRALVTVVDDPEQVIDAIATYVPPPAVRALAPEQT
jgi:uncharacterized protein (TIGR00730 family)